MNILVLFAICGRIRNTMIIIMLIIFISLSFIRNFPRVLSNLIFGISSL